MQINGWGRNVFMGYLNKENETRDALTSDNWLKLGDLGFLDEDGFVSILGKNRSVFKIWYKSDNFIQ